MKFSSGYVAVQILACCLVSFMTFANEKIAVSVSDQSGDSIEYAVISAFAQDGEQHSSVPLDKITVIDQIDKEFIAYVTPIQVGTAIEFPNHDQIRHHVYSFSPAKKFEIPLYKNLPANPVLFENTGVVSLGCNIHDWMSAYIYVVDTPYFAMTDNNGLAVLELPAGDYELRYWHPKVDKESSDSSQMINLKAGLAQDISIQLGLKQTWSLRRGPFSSNNRGRYR